MKKIDNQKIDNQKIDFYVIYYFYKFFFFFLLAGVISRHINKMEQEIANSLYTEWRENKLQIEVVQN